MPHGFGWAVSGYLLISTTTTHLLWTIYLYGQSISLLIHFFRHLSRATWQQQKCKHSCTHIIWPSYVTGGLWGIHRLHGIHQAHSGYLKSSRRPYEAFCTAVVSSNAQDGPLFIYVIIYFFILSFKLYSMRSNTFPFPKITDELVLPKSIYNDCCKITTQPSG